MTLRSLPDVARAARNQGLKVVQTLMREVFLECPICKTAGLKAMASVTFNYGHANATCRGCEAWNDDPHEILRVLGHDELKDDPHEIVLRIFDLLWALERAAHTDTIRDIQSGREPRNKSNAFGSVTGCPSPIVHRQPAAVSTP